MEKTEKIKYVNMFIKDILELFYEKNNLGAPDIEITMYTRYKENDYIKVKESSKNRPYFYNLENNKTDSLVPLKTHKIIIKFINEYKDIFNVDAFIVD